MVELFIQDIIHACFGTETFVTYHKIKRGLTNHNYRLDVQGGRSFFLKIFYYNEPERIHSVVRIVDALNELGFDTPAVKAMVDGAFLWCGQDHQAFVTEYIEGEEPTQNHENLFRMGMSLAKLHGFSHELKKYAVRGYSVSLGGERMIAESRPLPSDLSELLERGLPLVENIPYSKLPVVVIHGDPFLDNAIIQDNKFYLVDFEGGCVDNALFDISRGILGSALKEGCIDLSLGRAFLDGYQELRPMVALERDYLYEYIIYAGLLSVLWRYNEFNIRRPSSSRAEIYQELLAPSVHFLEQNKEDVCSALLD